MGCALRGGLLPLPRCAAVRRPLRAQPRAGPGAPGARLVDPRAAARVAHAAGPLCRRRAGAGGHALPGDAPGRAGDAVHARHLGRRVAWARWSPSGSAGSSSSASPRSGWRRSPARPSCWRSSSAPRFSSAVSRRSACCSSGLAANSVCSALIIVIYGLAGSTQSFSISRWLIGSLDSVDYTALAIFVARRRARRRGGHSPGQGVEPDGRGSVVGRDARRECDARSR